MRELINQDVPRTWRERTGGQLKAWVVTLKEDLVWDIRPAVVGIRRRNKERASLAMDLAQDRGAWSAAVPDAVHADSARVG